MLMAEIISAELAKVSPAPVPKTEAAPADKSGEPAAQK